MTTEAVPVLPAWLNELKTADDYSQTIFEEQVVKHGQCLIRVAEAAAAVDRFQYRSVEEMRADDDPAATWAGLYQDLHAALRGEQKRNT